MALSDTPLVRLYEIAYKNVLYFAVLVKLADSSQSSFVRTEKYKETENLSIDS